MCFYTKMAKKKIMLKDVHWVSMYSDVYNVRLWRTSRFCFYAFSLLYSSPLLSSDVPLKHKPAFFLFCCCCSVGPEVFAFSPSVLSVNLCYCEWAFVSFICSTERVEWFSEKQTQKPKVRRRKKKKRQRRKRYTGRHMSCSDTETRNKNPQRINHLINNQIAGTIINQTLK